MGDTCVSSLTVIDATSNQLEYKVLYTNNTLLPEDICCLKTCNVVASKEIVGDTCVPSLIVINKTINQLESKEPLITTYCLRLYVVVYNHVMLQGQR